MAKVDGGRLPRTAKTSHRAAGSHDGRTMDRWRRAPPRAATGDAGARHAVV